jgi:dTDP-4-dehydrorhamnose 3,5-epimerase
LLDFSPIQINIVNSKKNVIRGLHTNSYNHQQNKLVTCAYGQIMDVVVDLRKNSSTFGKYSSIELTANMGNSIFIPNGFAHGYMVMSENAVVVYQVDKEYHPESEVILNPFDSELNIEWGENQFYILSARDQYSNNLSQLIREGSL